MLVLAMVGAGSPVLAAQPEPQDTGGACAGEKPALPDELSGWATPGSVLAATDAAGLGNVGLVPGRAVMARLHPVGDVKYVLPPTHSDGADSNSMGGMVVFEAPVAGTYRIMLGHKAWLEIVRGGETAAAIHHQHGPACSGIGKMVDFELPAGRSVIELSEASAPEIEIMIAAVP